MLLIFLFYIGKRCVEKLIKVLNQSFLHAHFSLFPHFPYSPLLTLGFPLCQVEPPISNFFFFFFSFWPFSFCFCSLISSQCFTISVFFLSTTLPAHSSRTAHVIKRHPPFPLCIKRRRRRRRCSFLRSS